MLHGSGNAALRPSCPNMKSRYFIFIFCAGVGLLYLFGNTAVEVFMSRRPAGAPPLSAVSCIGVVLAALIAAATLLHLTVHLINSLFFPHARLEDPLDRKHLGPVKEEYPSAATRASHAGSQDPFWVRESRNLDEAEKVKSRSNGLVQAHSIR